MQLHRIIKIRTYLFSLGREPEKESLMPPSEIGVDATVVEEKAAKERFLVGVFLDARLDSVLNQDVLFVRRVVTAVEALVVDSIPPLAGRRNGESLER